MSRTHRIAIIGVGAIAGMHARAIGDLANAELVAGSCRTEEKGRRFVGEFGGTWYADSMQMLDREKPDVVTICTPSGAHLEPLRACAERGIHVLCEKPLEITAQRVDAMSEAAGRAGVILGGIFPQRYNPVVTAVHDAAGIDREANPLGLDRFQHLICHTHPPTQAAHIAPLRAEASPRLVARKRVMFDRPSIGSRRFNLYRQRSEFGAE